MTFILALTTYPNQSLAEKMATRLVSERLAACVQLSAPIESIYRWKNKIEKTQEVQMWIKTTREHFPAVTEMIRKNHPYDVPEVISIPIQDGLNEYLNWIHEETKKD